MSEESKNPEKKLIIDEDWKSQVEAEKEAVRHEVEAGKSTDESSSAAVGPLPPASLAFLISTFYLQAMMAMGLMPNPMTNKAAIDRDRAKHTIDMLAMLQQKTEGNRTQEESDDLEAALHELRLTFVSIK
jgi:hypothetical protein